MLGKVGVFAKDFRKEANKAANVLLMSFSTVMYSVQCTKPEVPSPSIWVD